ncbi:MAG: 2,3-bisphosphoglycerate-independent phosphoglycerate mutase, partial [Gemmatimonadota bacterium]
MSLELLQELHRPAETKILLLVLDGVGGLPMREGGPTELEAASTPNLDRLARDGSLGLHDPVAPGITPGSGSGHLALFGYDPVRYRIGRGVLEAVGIEFPLRTGDIAARGNFCTLDDSGRIADRRAGRLGSQPAKELLARLRSIGLPGVELILEHIREHRFLVVLRGSGLCADVTDTDPSREGVPPAPLRPKRPEAQGTADLVQRFLTEARERLREEA